MHMKHSGPGIGSFITSILSSALIFILILIAGIIEISTPGGMDEESVAAIFLGLMLLGFMFLSVIALVLGIAGLLQRERRKIYAILGTIFSATSILSTISLMLIGLVMG